MSADSNAHSEIGRDAVRDRNALQAEQRGTRKELVVPWWLTLIIVIETLPMFLGPIAALFFPSSLPGLTGGEGPGVASMLYSARNLSVGLAFIIAYALKSGPMLFVLILIRLLTDLVDLPTLLTFGSGVNKARLTFIFVCFYYIPAVVALRYLWQQIASVRAGE